MFSFQSSRKSIKIISYTFNAIFFSFLFVSSVSASVDPVNLAHPHWTIPQGTAKIDGILDKDEWSNAYKITRSQAWRDDGVAVISMMYSHDGLFLAIDVDDKNLWSDGLGGGAGNRWEVESDDSIMFYFDSNNSRDLFFSEDDRAFGVNLANLNDPLNGEGIVRRWKYVKGSGDGGAPDVVPGGELVEGTVWATQINGTVNNSSDQDKGWVTEIFLPWAALNMSTPIDGQTMGMNFDLIFDNTGGDRDLTDHRSGTSRFVLPAFIDDHIQGSHSSYHSTLAGINGPVNYAEVMFVAQGSILHPKPISDLKVDKPSAFGAILNFTAPANISSENSHVSYYEIRYSKNPISNDATWVAATIFANRYNAKSAGQKERLRISGLQPKTSYYVAIRARNQTSGLLGNLSNVQSITTLNIKDNSDKGRLIVSPSHNGLMFENGTPFVPVGEHAGISWGYFRNLFPGDVWDPNNQKYQNYFRQPSYEGTAEDHFVTLANSSVNALRLYLETLDMDQTGNPEKPRGRYWIEFPAGNFNPDMKQYVLNALEAAAKQDIYLIIAPFDSGQWDETFTNELPYYQGNGGPLASIDDFFQTPKTLDMAKARMQAVINWVKESPHSDHLLAWDPLSEWDSYEWTLNPEGELDPGREREMVRRIKWISELNDFIRQQDPDHLVMTSTTVRDPRGPLARYLFQSNNFDFLAPHFYTTSSEEPINTPDTDKKVKPAVENGLLTTYWLTHQTNNVPLLNSEWGMTRHPWPNHRPTYSSTFTQEEDDALYRTVSWSGLASGQLGSGLRIVTEELVHNYNSVTDVMRDVELTISRFLSANKLPSNQIAIQRKTLAGSIKASSTNHALNAWGIGDELQGLSYILQDGNVTQGQVNNATLSIQGLNSNQLVDIEFWKTKGAATQPYSTLKSQVSYDGNLSFPLPPFNEDLAIKYTVSNCAIFSNPQLKIPCVEVDNNIYQAALNLKNESSLTFELDQLQTSRQYSKQQCATYTAKTTKLHLPCVIVGNQTYKADLILNSPNPITLQVINYAQ